MSAQLPPLDPSESSSSASSLSSIATRRIRFAPLPDPQALHADDDDDDDDETHGDEQVISAKACHAERVAAKAPTTQQLLSHPPITHAPSWQRPKSLNLLRPFPFRRSHQQDSDQSSHNSLTPTQSNDTPTITLNLFRPTSKEQPSSAWGFGLTRWSSSSGSGVPLTRTQSSTSLSRTQSAQSAYTPSISSKLKLSSFKPSSSHNKTKRPSTSDGITAPKPTPTTNGAKAPTRKGTRLLNGRVYGAKKRPGADPNANPFANARDEDPEFVEWGYGGMGSVRGARQAGITGDHANASGTRWERLQSDGTFMNKKDHEEDADDGTGMGWVKKRKEQREREKREREREEKESEAALRDEVTPPPAPAPAPVDVPSAETPSPAPTPTLEHNLTTVTLPTHLSRHHSHRRTATSDSAHTIQPSSSTTTTTTTTIASPSPLSKSSSDDSESSDEDGDNEYEDDEEEEEEEEDERTKEKRRKMVEGAGVEKISRHNQ